MEPHDADRIIEQNAVVRLTHGSLLNWQDLMQLNGELQAMQADRDRARRLAARLEEVVAARTAVLRALDTWLDSPEEHDYLEIANWARAQLQEVP